MTVPMFQDTPLLVSVDCEYTGPSTADGELCSIGAAMMYPMEQWDDNRLIVAKFSVNLQFMYDAPKPFLYDKEIIAWWEKYPQQWAEHRKHALRFDVAMEYLYLWLRDYTNKPVFAAWPAAADWQFVSHYFGKAGMANPFGYSPFCLKNYALGRLNRPLAVLGHREEVEMPESWLVTPESLGLTSHIALDDAVAQAHMIRNILTAELYW